MPRVSIVMPMLNARRFVRQAIESVLNQDVHDLEIIIVDDGSTDGSGTIVRQIGDARLRLIKGESRGVAAAFNAGLAAARGQFLARCDADDLYTAGRLAWQLAWLEAHQEFGAVCGAFSSMDAKGRFLRNLECGDAAAEITDELRAGKTRASFCTWLVRADVVRRLGGCREYFVSAEDIDLQFRLSEACRVWYEPRSCYAYRLHDASVTHSTSTSLRYFYYETARRMQKQRLGGAPDDVDRGNGPHVPSELQITDARNGSRSHAQELLLGAAWNEHAAGQRIKALRTALRACLASPINIQAWRSLGALALRSRA